MIYLRRRDRQLARTSVKFRRLYKLETTLDLGVLVLVARSEASLEKAWIAIYDYNACVINLSKQRSVAWRVIFESGSIFLFVDSGSVR